MSAEPSALIVKVWSKGLVTYTSPRRLQVPCATSLVASNISRALRTQRVRLSESKTKPVFNLRQANSDAQYRGAGIYGRYGMVVGRPGTLGRTTFTGAKLLRRGYGLPCSARRNVESGRNAKWESYAAPTGFLLAVICVDCRASHFYRQVRHRRHLNQLRSALDFGSLPAKNRDFYYIAASNLGLEGNIP